MIIINPKPNLAINDRNLYWKFLEYTNYEQIALDLHNDNTLEFWESSDDKVNYPNLIENIQRKLNLQFGINVVFTSRHSNLNLNYHSFPIPEETALFIRLSVDESGMYIF